MELRSQAAALAAAAFSMTFPVTHQRLMKDHAGTLRFDEAGVSFEETRARKPAQYSWAYEDIQRLEVSEQGVRILTYQDREWLAGSDQAFDFTFGLHADWSSLDAELRHRLDERYVARLPGNIGAFLWRVPVKRLGRLKGSEGELRVGTEGISYGTTSPGRSRTWRLSDIRNVMTSDPFSLSVSAPEGTYEFQLKQALPEREFQRLWLQLNRHQGLQILTTYQ